MDPATAIAKLKELSEKVALAEVEGRNADAAEIDAEIARAKEATFAEKIEAVRKSVEDMATALGVEVTADSFAVPIPIELLSNIVNRLLSLEDRAQPLIEAIPFEEL
jgi:hypothetical protein